MIIKIDDFDFEKLNINTINMMCYLNEYLEDEWIIKKKNNCFIISKNKSKIYTLEYLKVNGTAIESDKQKYILTFLFNGLSNGWSIKKINKKYIFSKKHEGKKEIFSDNYINTFMKDNFNFNLIK
jgi:hypothetical protein